jgi:hypothetical protein
MGSIASAKVLPNTPPGDAYKNSKKQQVDFKNAASHLEGFKTAL